ncbi:hypothetical protein OFD18_32590, partial [Escherichia coli]|nr:hypothetical protein [Escherichia coli]
ALGFTVTVDGQTSTLFTNTSVAYAPPAVTSVSAPVLATRGDDAFNVTGDNFGPLGSAVTVQYAFTWAAASDRPVYTARRCAVVVAHTR